MDPFDFQTAKAEGKMKAWLRFHRLRGVLKLFRLAELCLGLVVLYWFLTRLPIAVKTSGEYFRQLVTVIVSPLFIFILGNFIVLSLLLKSGRALDVQDDAELKLCEEFLENSDHSTSLALSNPSPPSAPDEIVYQDKQTIFEVNTTAQKVHGHATNGDSEDTNDDVPEPKLLKAYKRCQSENSRREVVEEDCGKLRRSETEKCRRVANPGEIPNETLYIFDELSNEEFRSAIEAFIAKQVKFHQEEKSDIVVHSQAHHQCPQHI